MRKPRLLTLAMLTLFLGTIAFTTLDCASKKRSGGGGGSGSTERSREAAEERR